MKKFLFLVSLVFCFVSCNNVNNNNSYISPEIIEAMESFHLVNNIEDLNIEFLDIGVFQTISDEECLAREVSDKKNKLYYGDVIYYIAGDTDLLYDNKVIKDSAYLVGTYTYETLSDRTMTVKAYVKDYNFAIQMIELNNRIKSK